MARRTGADRVDTGTMLKRGTAGTLLAAAVNAVVAWVAVHALNLPASFEPIEIPRVLGFTVLGCILAIVAFAIVQRVAERPARMFLVVAAVALLASFVPDVALLVDPSVMPGTTTRGVLVLMAMHVLAAIILVTALLGGRVRAAMARA